MDWNTIRDNAIAAAKGVLGGAWSAAANGATAQITQLTQTAQYINDHLTNGTLTSAEGQFLMAQQKSALQNVLTAYESIAIAAAINAVNAVVTSLINAVPALIGIA